MTINQAHLNAASSNIDHNLGASLNDLLLTSNGWYTCRGNTFIDVPIIPRPIIFLVVEQIKMTPEIPNKWFSIFLCEVAIEAQCRCEVNFSQSSMGSNPSLLLCSVQGLRWRSRMCHRAQQWMHPRMPRIPKLSKHFVNGWRRRSLHLYLWSDQLSGGSVLLMPCQRPRRRSTFVLA